MEQTALQRIKEIEERAASKFTDGPLFHPEARFGLVSGNDVPFLLKACNVWRDIAAEFHDWTNERRDEEFENRMSK